MNQLNKGISEKIDLSVKGISQIEKNADKNQKALTSINKDMVKILKK